MGTIFGNFGGSKVDRDFFVGEAEPRVNDGGTDTLTGFADGLVGHANNVKGR